MTAAPARGRTSFDSTSALIALAWAAIVGPTLVQSLTAPKYRAAVSDQVAYSPVASLTNLTLTLMLVSACVLILIRRLRDLPVDGRGVLLVLLLPWIYQVSRDLYADTTPKLGGLLYPLIVLTVWALRPSIDRLSLLGYLVGLTAVISLLMGALLPAKGIFSSVAGEVISPDKEILPWGVLVGPFTNGNNLGQFLALGAPAIALIPRRWVRLALGALTVLAIVWTSSRSSLAALVVGTVVALGLAATPRRARAGVAAAIVAAGVFVVAYLPLTTTRNDAFTNRGYIWRASMGYWADQPWTGLGSQWYAQSAKYANNIGGTAYHGHNQFVQLLVLGGIVNLVLFSLVLVLLLRAAAVSAAAGRVVPTAFLAMLCTAGTLEVAFSFVHRSFMLPVTLLPLAVFAFSAVRSAPAPAPFPAQRDPADLTEPVGTGAVPDGLTRPGAHPSPVP